MPEETPSQPNAPDSLPKYIHEGLPKQDIETLQETQQYIEALIEQKQAEKHRPVPEEEIPDGADMVDDVDVGGSGTVVKEKVKCGKSGCKCASGELHGPYLYRYYRDESGTVKSEYVGSPGDIDTE